MLRKKNLVSIGVPVCNGGEKFTAALDTLVCQTYPHVEIIISDNCSTDGTREIAEIYSKKYPNITYFFHKTRVDAIDNFKFTFLKSRGEFFMWAAHDDLRSKNYVEVLLGALQDRPNSVLSYTNILWFNDENEGSFEVREYGHASMLSRVASVALGSCIPIYGMIRSDVLNSYKWYAPVHGPDRVILTYLICMGDFIFVNGATFKYHFPVKEKTIRQRVATDYAGRTIRFPHFEESWCCSLAVADAIKNKSLYSIIGVFLLVYLARIKKSRAPLWRNKIRQKIRKALYRFNV